MPDRNGVAKPLAAVLFAVLSLIVPTALLAQAPAFDVPNMDATPGQEVSLSVSFDSQGGDVCAVSTDVTFDGTKLMWVGGQAGPAGSSSGKNLVSQAMGSNGVRLGLIGMNSTRIPNGVVMVLKFKVAPNASGAVSLTFHYGAAGCAGQDFPASSGTSYISLGGGDCKVTCNPMAAPTSGNPPLAVTFNAQVQSTCKGDLTYSWQFGDGTTSSEPAPRHTYNNPGQYRFSLEVISEHEKCSREGMIQVGESQQGDSQEQGDASQTGQSDQAGQAGQTGSQGSGATNAGQATETAEEDSEEAPAEPENASGGEKEVKPLSVKVVTTPKKGPSPLKVRLRTTITGGKPPYKVTWDFGDKSEAGKKVSVLHTYEKPGKYKPSVEVKDSGEETASAAGEELLVQDPPVADLKQVWLVPGDGVVTLEFVGEKFQKGCTAAIGGKKYDTEFADSKHIKIKGFADPKGSEIKASITNPYGKPSAEVKAELKPKEGEGAAKSQEPATTP